MKNQYSFLFENQFRVAEWGLNTLCIYMISQVYFKVGNFSLFPVTGKGIPSNVLAAG